MKSKRCKRCEASAYMHPLNQVGLCGLCVAEIAEGMEYPKGAYALVRNQEGNVVFLFHESMEAYKQKCKEVFNKPLH